MWQETKHGLYRQFNFENFTQAFDFMTKVAELAEEQNHHPRWENEWSVVQIWLITHEGDKRITDKDRDLATAIDQLIDQPQDNVEIKPNDTKKRYKKLKLYADGGSRGNPGPSASGYVIFDEAEKIIVDRGVYLGVTTNNQAEYTALKLAIENCIELGALEVEVLMDSLLVVNQMKGIFKVKNRDLWPIHDAIKTMAETLKHVSYQHVPREYNKLADAAVNRALDEELSSNNQTNLL
ncbi:MAG TPA: 4a-hydroxytetrahydrobiopterin dehydratase [Candidatus Saccharimonadales bacterium]